MKECSKCKRVLDLDQFRKIGAICKDCRSIYEFNRREKRKIYYTEWAKTNLTEERKKAYSEAQKAKQPIRNYPSRRIFVLTCQATGKLFISRKRTIKYSKEGLIIHRHAQASRNGTISNSIPRSRTCTICNSQFMGTYVENHCSDVCRRVTHSISGRKVKAKKKGATIVDTISHLEIFNKYNWHCDLCGVHTPISSIGSNLANEPTLDHVLPLSKGGQHTHTNVQLLCRACNDAKGNNINISNALIINRSLRRRTNNYSV